MLPKSLKRQMNRVARENNYVINYNGLGDIQIDKAPKNNPTKNLKSPNIKRKKFIKYFLRFDFMTDFWFRAY